MCLRVRGHDETAQTAAANRFAIDPGDDASGCGLHVRKVVSATIRSPDSTATVQVDPTTNLPMTTPVPNIPR